MRRAITIVAIGLLVFALAALAGFGFHTALAGRPLFGRPLLDD